MISFNKYLSLDGLQIKQHEFNSFGELEPTAEWISMRKGVVTASRVHDIIKKGRAKDSKSEAYMTYAKELALSIITTSSQKEVRNHALEWGRNNENEARKAFELVTLETVDEVGFIYGDESLRYGVSPDGLVNGRHGVEIKCPYNSINHLDFIMHGTIKPEYISQVQFSLWVTGFESWSFVSYDPRFKQRQLEFATITPDLEMFATFEEEIPVFTKVVDEILNSFNLKFGDQWNGSV